MKFVCESFDKRILQKDLEGFDLDEHFFITNTDNGWFCVVKRCLSSYNPPAYELWSGGKCLFGRSADGKYFEMVFPNVTHNLRVFV